MLFQASAEKSEPTWLMQKATKRPKRPAVAAVPGTHARSGRIGAASCGVHRSEKLAAIAVALRPTKIPSTIKARSDSVFAEVKTFWISLPRWMPRVLRRERKTINRMPTSCCVDRLTA